LVDVAFWDLVGKAAGKPLYKYWGGTDGEMDLYASTAEMVSADRSPDIALQAREDGFKAIKLRAHHMDIRDDIRAVAAVREAVGDSMKIMVDANQGCVLSLAGPEWDFDTALEFANAMSELGLYWLEEPLHRFDYNGIRKLRDRVDIRIAGGELNEGIHEFKVMMEKDCYDVYQPDAVFAGGVSMCLDVAAMAMEKGKMFSPHTWSDGIGFAINAHIAAKVRGCPFLEFPYEPESWTPQVWCAMQTEPFLPENGRITLPDAPGLGIELDEDVIRKHAKRL